MRKLPFHTIFFIIISKFLAFAVEGIDPPRQVTPPSMPTDAKPFSPSDYSEILENSLKNFLLSDTTIKYYEIQGTLSNLTLSGHTGFRMIKKPKRAGEKSILKSNLSVSLDGCYEKITVPTKFAKTRLFWQSPTKRSSSINVETNLTYKQRNLEEVLWKTPLPTLLDGGLKGNFIWADMGMSILANWLAFGCQTKMHNTTSGDLLYRDAGGSLSSRQHIKIKDNWGIWAQEGYFLANLNMYEALSPGNNHTFVGKYSRRAYSGAGGVFWSDGTNYFRAGCQIASNWRRNSLFPSAQVRLLWKNGHFELASGTNFSSNSLSDIIRGEPELEITPNFPATTCDTVGMSIQIQHKHITLVGWATLGRGYDFAYPYTKHYQNTKYAATSFANIDILRASGAFSLSDTLIKIPFSVNVRGISDYSEFSKTTHKIPLTPKYIADGEIVIFPFTWLSIRAGALVFGDFWLDTTFHHWQSSTLQFFGSLIAKYKNFYLEIGGENLTGRMVWEFPTRFHTNRIYRLTAGYQVHQ